MQAPAYDGTETEARRGKGFETIQGAPCANPIRATAVTLG
jgi:hypothetical protein